MSLKIRHDPVWTFLVRRVACSPSSRFTYEISQITIIVRSIRLLWLMARGRRRGDYLLWPSHLFRLVFANERLDARKNRQEKLAYRTVRFRRFHPWAIDFFPCALTRISGFPQIDNLTIAWGWCERRCRFRRND